MTFIVERLKESDSETVVNLFYGMVDELHAGSHVAERLHFKDMYPVEEVKKRLDNKDYIYLVG